MLIACLTFFPPSNKNIQGQMSIDPYPLKALTMH